MSVNRDKIKAGDWVQIANGDWYEVHLCDHGMHGLRLCILHDNPNYEPTVDSVAYLLTAHLTMSEARTACWQRPTQSPESRSGEGVNGV